MIVPIAGVKVGHRQAKNKNPHSKKEWGFFVSCSATKSKNPYAPLRAKKPYAIRRRVCQPRSLYLLRGVNVVFRARVLLWG